MNSKGKDAKPHIGIFGCRNKGKSSIINVFAKQEVAIVSAIPGTTTDPVKKSIEIPGIGPVILIDTAGIDDSGELGLMRTEKSIETINTVDAALLIISDNYIGDTENKLINTFTDFDIPYLLIHNKADIQPLSIDVKKQIEKETGTQVIDFSAVNPAGLENLIIEIKKIIPQSAYQKTSLVGNLVKHGDTVLLITPVDIEAPEGRLILPQIQVIRDVLDNDCIAIVVKERELDTFLKRLSPRPSLAITDSQVFLKADAGIPKDIPLTSFSIVLAYNKGDFDNYLKGTPHLGKLKDGDRLLILESCTHHVSCDDIGRMKIPRWISNFSGRKLDFDVVSGLDSLPREIHDYAIVIQCGGCMITRKQLMNRLKPAIDAGIPVTNYGMTIAWVQGIYERAVSPFTKIPVSSDYL